MYIYSCLSTYPTCGSGGGDPAGVHGASVRLRAPQLPGEQQLAQARLYIYIYT